MPPEGDLPTDVLGPITIVLGDANVLYPRVLRDYLVYASDQGAIALRWSREILDEVVGHLAENIATSTPEQGDLLIRLLNSAFPYAEVVPSPAARRKVNALDLPDEDDRHVLAAHRSAVTSLTGATDASTLAALRRANATKTADLMAQLLDL